MNGPDPHDLLDRSLDLTARLDQHSALQSFVESAIKLTGAAYGACRSSTPGGTRASSSTRGPKAARTASPARGDMGILEKIPRLLHPLPGGGRPGRRIPPA